MPAFSIKLAKLYQLDLAQSKIEEKKWAEQPVKNKMRKFFSASGWVGTGFVGSWETCVESVTCSTGGAKGVFFLNLQDRPIGKEVIKASLCAVKATDAPQQTLFAEYVLKDLGQAKIPKSLVIKLDWSEFTKKGYDALNSNWAQFDPKKEKDDGLKILWVIMTKKDKTLSPQEQIRYQDLQTDLFTNKPRYFVIMKGVRIDNKLDFITPFKRTPQADPFNLPNQGHTNQAYGLCDLGMENKLDNWWNEFKQRKWNFSNTGYPPDVRSLRLTQNFIQETLLRDSDFEKVLKRIVLNKVILSNTSLMVKAGRILAIDTLIGNTDRFEGSSNGMNVGNAFFYSKRYQNLQKAANPIAVIDNDAMLTILDLSTPEGTLGYNSNNSTLFGTFPLQDQKFFGATLKEQYQTRYIKYVLEDGMSALAFGAGGKGVFAYPNLKRIFKEFDLYIAEQLIRTFIPQRFPLITDIYADDGTILPGVPGSYPRFSDKPYSQQPPVLDPTWKPVVDNIRAGFLEGMDAILNLDLEQYRSVYSHLVRLYGISTQFDFTAFEVRFRYINDGPKWLRAGNGKIIGFQHDDNGHQSALGEVKKYLATSNPSKENIENVLTDAEKNGRLSKEERRLATQMLRLQFCCP